jgi:hypothetical protein
MIFWNMYRPPKGEERMFKVTPCGKRSVIDRVCWEKGMI